MITIFRKGSVVCSLPTDNASLAEALMGKNEITVEVVSEAVLPVRILDYTLLGGVAYTLNREPNFTKDSNNRYRYNLTFESPLYNLLDKRYTHSITKQSRFILTGTLRDFVELVVVCANETDMGWTVGAVPETPRKMLIFESMTCGDVLNKLADEFSVEYNVAGRRIDFYARFEQFTNLVFQQGRGKGLYSLTRQNVDSSNTVTRATLYGGTKNIPLGYRNGSEYLRWANPETGDMHVENLTDYPKIVERDVYFDDVYPHFEGAVDGVSGENLEVVRCAAIDFDINKYLIGGVTAKINFVTGDLTGNAFELTYDHAAKEVTLVRKEDETAAPDAEGKRPMIPSAARRPQPGDVINFTDITMPDEYVVRAEQQLHDKGVEWLVVNSQLRVKFNLAVDHRYLRREGIALHVGNVVRIQVPESGIDRLLRVISLERHLKTGALTCEVSNYPRYSWEKDIEGKVAAASERAELVKSEVLYDLNASKEWTARNYARLRGGNELEGDQQINGMLGVGEAVLRYMGEKVLHLRDKLFNNNIVMKLFRLHAQQVVADELVGSESFAPGLTGHGWRIGGDGSAELESVRVRRFLEVPELRYNRVDVSMGDQWRAPGGGIIESVDEQQQIITLKLEQGEAAAVRQGDICMGIFHAMNAELNAKNNSDDGMGNRTFAGFSTVYFSVEEILSNNTFRYALRPTSEKYPRANQPAAAMHFVSYGSFTDPARRTSVYATRTYERYLRDVDSWEFAARNIAGQFGDLSNLSIWGIDMRGYSACLNNIYLTGTIRQLDAAGNPVPDQFARWRSGLVYRAGAIVSLAGWSFRALRDTAAPPVGLLMTGGSYLTTGGGYILVGAPDKYLSEDWEVFMRPPVDGRDGANGAPGANGADGLDGRNGVDGKDGAKGDTGQPGAQGIQGCIMRSREWAPNTEYHNDEALTTFPRFLDVVMIGSGNNLQVWRCAKTHTSGAAHDPAMWREMNVLDAVYASTIFAQNALIKFMQGQQIVVQDADGNIVGGLSGADIAGMIWPLFAGSSDPSTAPCRVNALGQLFATKAQIEGVIKALSGSIGGFEIASGRLGRNATSTSPNTVTGMTLTGTFLRFADANGIAMLGSNTIPPSSGGAVIMQSLRVNKAWGSYAPQSNTALALSAKGHPETYADMGRNNALHIEAGNFVHEGGMTIQPSVVHSSGGTIITRGRTNIKLAGSSPGTMNLQSGFNDQMIRIINVSGGARTITGLPTGDHRIDHGHNSTFIYSNEAGWCPEIW